MASLRFLKHPITFLLVVGVLAGCSRRDVEETATEAQSPYAGVHIFEGRVADSSCGATHKIDDAVQCTESCVAAGGTYVLVVGDVVHALEGNADEIKPFAGQTVQVSASLDGNTLRVERIGPPAGPPQEG